MSSKEPDTSAPKQQKKPRRKGLAPVLMLLFLGTGGFLWFFLNAPPEIHPQERTVFVVNRGEGASLIGERLIQGDLIRNSLYFRLRYERFPTRKPPFYAGRFTIPPGASSTQIISILTNPENRLLTKVTIREGWTLRQTGEELEARNITSLKAFLQASAAFPSREQGEYPFSDRMESMQGYLFPDTYFLESLQDLDNKEQNLQKAREVIEIMVNRFFQVLKEIDPAWGHLTPAQLYEKVILASLVEREYKVPREAPLIAKVFSNRLRDESYMQLQSCATIDYILRETPVGAPFRQKYDETRRIIEPYLELNSPYNTYQNYGLPPGPISNPGKEALLGAFYPSNGDFDPEILYFVLKPDGSREHEFRTTLADHNEAKKIYLSNFGKR